MTKTSVGMAVGLAMVFAQSAMVQQNPVQENADCVNRVDSLSDAELRHIISYDFEGNSDPSNMNGVDLRYVARDKVTVAGKRYPLIFVGSDEGSQWSDLKSSLPPDIAQGLATPLSDQQTAVYVRSLAAQAEQRFLSVEVGAYGINREKFAAQFAPGISDTQIHDSVMRGYRDNDNGQIAPEAQKAYNQYAALSNLSDALDLYNKFSTNELAASCKTSPADGPKPPR